MNKEAIKLALNDVEREVSQTAGRTKFASISKMREVIEALAEQSAPVQQEPVACYGLLQRMALALEVCGMEWRKTDPDLRIDIANKLVEQSAQQQEPVACLLVGHDSDGRYVSIAAKAHADTLPLGEYKLYTSPQPAQRKPLTDEELDKCMRQAKLSIAPAVSFRIGFRAAEAAHNIKEQP